MQGNDIGTEVSKRIVVVLEPLLMAAPDKRPTMFLGRRHGRMMALAGTFEINAPMTAFIAQMGYTYSVATEVWTFLPQDLLDLLAPRIDTVVGHHVIEYTSFASVHDAYMRLRSDPTIITVYDGDLDRVQCYWHLRGAHVMPGTAP